MAICFELVVNFGQNFEAAQAARASPNPMTLRAGHHHVPRQRALLRDWR